MAVAAPGGYNPSRTMWGTMRLAHSHERDMPDDASHAQPPAVTVVIPTRGRRPLLEQTIASVQAQTMADWEAVVVDDASPDDTADWLRGAASADPRIRPLSATGSGANAARNQGFAAARGRYVVFLDSDDLLEPDCLLLRVQLLDGRPDLDYTVNAMRCFRQHPTDTDCAWNTLTDEDDLDRFLQMDGPWQTTGVTWRRAALDVVGGWDVQVLSLQDLDFHARALAAPLRLLKVNAWDCLYRLPFERDAITSRSRSKDHTRSHAHIAWRMLDFPDAVLDATPARRDLLAAFCFLIATRCAVIGDLSTAVKLWTHTRRRRAVGWRRYAAGMAVLVSHVGPKLGNRLRWRLSHKWPAIWRGEFRSTLFHAPLPPQASTATVPGDAPPQPPLTNAA